MSQDDHLPDLDGGARSGVRDEDDATLPRWQRPTITRLSLDRTLVGPGSNFDGSTSRGDFL